MQPVRKPAFFHRLPHAVLLPLLIIVAGCSDEGSHREEEPAAPAYLELTVTPSLGLISNATVTWEPLGEGWNNSGNTGLDGTIVFTVPAELAGPFLVTVCGNETATYFDEALLASLPFPAERCLRALLPDNTRTDVAVTALTEAVVHLLEQGEGGLAAITAADIRLAHEQVRSRIAPELSDLLSSPVLIGSADDLAALTNTEAGRHAAKLALLARAAAALAATRNGSDTPALDFAEQLSADIADGELDGLGPDGFLVSSVYDIFQLNALLHAGLGDTGIPEALADILDALTLSNVQLPSGSDPLLSWQGSYAGTWQGLDGINTALSYLSGLHDDYQNLLPGVIAGEACTIVIGDGTVQVSGLPLVFEFTATDSADENGIRRFVMSREDASSYEIGAMSFPVVTTATATLNTTGTNMSSIDLAASANILNLATLNATASCVVAAAPGA